MPPSKPLISSVFCLAGNSGLAQALAATFPEAAIRTVSEAELADAAAQDSGAAVLAVGDASDVTAARLEAVNDDAGLPRWAVARFGSDADASGDRPDVLPARLWQPAHIARAVHTAMAEHQLRRENAQLRGDLRTLATRVAHDLRTPLGGILTTAEMLREMLTEDSPDMVPFTKPIVDSAEAQAGLIERMSFYGKAVSSSARAEPFDMGTAFWNAYQQLESRIFKAQAVLKHAPTWPKLVGHAGWSEAIWRNLLANSIQHGGAAVQIEAGWTQRDGCCEFWVQDSGMVPDAKRATLFFPFHLLHSHSAPRGLGLPITRRLVELQGGTCGYAPLAPRGSRFHFTLPAAAATA